MLALQAMESTFVLVRNPDAIINQHHAKACATVVVKLKKSVSNKLKVYTKPHVTFAINNMRNSDYSCIGRFYTYLQEVLWLFLLGTVIILILTKVIEFLFGSETIFTKFLKDNYEWCTPVLAILFFVVIGIVDGVRDYYIGYKLTDKERILLDKFNFSKMSRKQKKTMAYILRIAPSIVHLRLSRMNLQDSINEFIKKEWHIQTLNAKDVLILMVNLPDMEYEYKGETHTLKEWHSIYSEIRKSKTK